MTLNFLLVAPEEGAGFELVCPIYEAWSADQAQAVLAELDHQGFPFAVIARAEAVNPYFAQVLTDAPDPAQPMSITIRQIVDAWIDRTRARLVQEYDPAEAIRRLRPGHERTTSHDDYVDPTPEQRRQTDADVRV